ncbi:hypothetical protein AWB76_07553 [Caballeronia temeraria]|uniref:Uncharacterized protein n=1 Tax=Caballeronia temeraria TaxID=1777137 RepID=A0A158DVK5_9BURK|nr:hypothetical protein [Caballeronia temeraria]SAK98584.1 hypothetical protein AWB76_07553 [Caballeronia temeraria]
MSQRQFDLLANLYDRVDLERGRRAGKLAIHDQRMLDALRSVVADQDEYAVHLPEDDPDAVKVGDEVAIELGTPRLGIGMFPMSFADLIRNPAARVSEPGRYYIVAERFNRCSDAVVPDVVQKYRKLLELVTLLGEAAAYVDRAGGHLIFIDEGKFDVPVQYASEDVEALDVGAIDRLIDALSTDIHREQKMAILAEAVRELTRSEPPQERFRAVLAHFPELLKKFNDGYRLFASSFSYEKVKSELEATRIEYAAKIHKVFTDIQNQILGIPVATVVVATQMKEASGFDANFYINTAILIGAWVFVILVSALLVNQTHTLDILEREIGRQRAELEKLHTEIASSFSSVFGFLDTRLKVQRRWLRVVFWILIGGGVLATAAFFVITGPARAALQWLIKLV